MAGTHLRCLTKSCGQHIQMDMQKEGGKKEKKRKTVGGTRGECSASEGRYPLYAGLFIPTLG